MASKYYVGVLPLTHHLPTRSSKTTSQLNPRVTAACIVEMELYRERFHEAKLEEGAAGLIVAAADVLTAGSLTVEARVTAPASATTTYRHEGRDLHGRPFHSTVQYTFFQATTTLPTSDSVS